MADDLTTTGATRIDDPRAAAYYMRMLPGANVIEHTPFTLDFKCDLIFTVSNNALIISLQMGKPDESGFRMDFPPRSLNDFEKPEDLNTYLDAVKTNFKTLLRPRMTQEAFSTLQVLILGLYFILNHGAGDRERIIKGYTEQATTLLESMLAALPAKLKPGTWSKVALRHAVDSAAFRLIRRGVKGRALTLDVVCEEMRTEHGEQTPASGEALRKQLEERGLNWRAIKGAAQRTAAGAEKAGVTIRFGRSTKGAKAEPEES